MLSRANYSTWKKGAASPKLSSAHFSASGREIKTRLCFCLFIFLLRSPRHTVFSSLLIYFGFEWKRRRRQFRLGSASPSSRMTYHRWQRRIWDGCEWRREGRRHEYREGKKSVWAMEWQKRDDCAYITYMLKHHPNLHKASEELRERQHFSVKKRSNMATLNLKRCHFQVFSLKKVHCCLPVNQSRSHICHTARQRQLSFTLTKQNEATSLRQAALCLYPSMRAMHFLLSLIRAHHQAGDGFVYFDCVARDERCSLFCSLFLSWERELFCLHRDCDQLVRLKLREGENLYV